MWDPRTLPRWRIAFPICLVVGLGSLCGAQEPTEGRATEASTAGIDDRPVSPDGPALASEIRDGAGLFAPEPRARAEGELSELDRRFEVPVLIETIRSVEGRAIEAVAPRRAHESGRTGLYVLITEEEKELCVLASRSYMAAIDDEARGQIRDAFLEPLRAGDYEEGLSRGVAAIGSVLATAMQAAQQEPGGRFRNVGEGRELVSREHIRIRLGGAEAILRAAEDQARSMGLNVNIAVVDDGGHLVAFARMDGARPGSGYTAQTKAVAAATFRSPTGPIPPGAGSPEPILNLGLALTAMGGGGRFTPLFGGVPIEVEGQVIGAVGVGGATGEQDAEIARAGIAALLAALGQSEE